MKKNKIMYIFIFVILLFTFNVKADGPLKYYITTEQANYEMEYGAYWTDGIEKSPIIKVKQGDTIKVFVVANNWPDEYDQIVLQSGQSTIYWDKDAFEIISKDGKYFNTSVSDFRTLQASASSSNPNLYLGGVMFDGVLSNRKYLPFTVNFTIDNEVVEKGIHKLLQYEFKVKDNIEDGIYSIRTFQFGNELNYAGKADVDDNIIYYQVGDSVTYNTYEVKPSDVPANTYIIGKYMFTNEVSDAYNGQLTTQHIMKAAMTNDSNKLDKMIIYLKNARGVWKNAINDNEITPPEHFNISYKDMVPYNKNVTPNLAQDVTGPDGDHLEPEYNIKEGKVCTNLYLVLGEGDGANFDGYEVYNATNDEKVASGIPDEHIEICENQGTTKTYYAKTYKTLSDSSKVYSEKSNNVSINFVVSNLNEVRFNGVYVRSNNYVIKLYDLKDNRVSIHFEHENYSLDTVEEVKDGSINFEMFDTEYAISKGNNFVNLVIKGDSELENGQYERMEEYKTSDYFTNNYYANEETLNDPKYNVVAKMEKDGVTYEMIIFKTTLSRPYTVMFRSNGEYQPVPTQLILKEDSDGSLYETNFDDVVVTRIKPNSDNTAFTVTFYDDDGNIDNDYETLGTYTFVEKVTMEKILAADE